MPKGEIVPSAERLRGLVQALYGTAAMPDGQGVLVSVGGDTVDLVIGSDPNVAFLGLDADDRFGFRVVERFVLRVKDRTACVRLELGGGPDVARPPPIAPPTTGSSSTVRTPDRCARSRAASPMARSCRRPWRGECDP